MTRDDLQSITGIKDRNARDILRQGAKGEIKLFTVVKKDLRVSYDEVEFHICPSTDTEQMSVYEDDEPKPFDRGEIIELPIEAIEELWLYRRLEGQKLTLVFPPPTENHISRSTPLLDVIELDDVYVDPQCLENPKKKKVNKQQQREALFSNWLKGQNTDAVSNMRKEDVWQELRKIDSKLFNANFKHFFRNQKMVTFKAGRKFQQTGQ